MALGNSIGVPFTKGSRGGGGGSFSFGNSYHFDGVNDGMNIGGGTPATSSTCFNTFNQTNWSAAMWLKADGLRFTNNCAAWSNGRTATDSGFGGMVFINGILGGNVVKIYSNLYNTAFTTYVVSAALVQAWTHYALTLEIISPTVQRGRLYINGTLVETKDFTNYALNDTDVAFALGKWPNNTVHMNGFMNQPVFQQSLLSDTDISNLYNGGSGATASDIMTTMKSGYLGTEAVGTTTGTITDVTGNQNLTTSGFVAPYGVVSDTP